MRSSSRVAALSAAFLWLSGIAVAQCQPWSKQGLRRLADWSPTSTLTVGDAEHGAAGIGLGFRGDATAGVVLHHVAHRGTRKDGAVAWVEYLAEPPAGQPKALWKAVVRPSTSDTPTELGPAHAASFEVWVDVQPGTRDALFAWNGITLPGASPDSRFWFELRVQVSAAAPARAVWNSRMGRITVPGTERWSMDEIHAPIVYCRHAGDVRQTRVLVPAALNAPLPVSNLSLWTWLLADYHLDFEHPARHQQMQFSALYCADPTQVPLADRILTGHRKILYFSTEDPEGWFKRFRHDVHADGTGVYYRWAPVYFPKHPPNPWRNTFVTPYPAVTAALQAETDAWWFDVAATYREFVRREMRLTPIDHPFYLLNRDFVRGSAFMPCSTVNLVNPDPDLALETFVDESIKLRQVFREANGAPTPFFMEWQKWLQGNPLDSPYPGFPPEDPMGPGLNPRPASSGEGFQRPTAAAKAEIARAHAAGINVSTYLLPTTIQAEHWPTFRDEWFLRRRDGSYHPMGNIPGKLVDFGLLSVPLWFNGTFFPDLTRDMPQLGGLFMDTLGGTSSYLRYPPIETHRKFLMRYHGGQEFVRGAALTMLSARWSVAKGKFPLAHPNIPFISTEAVQEGLAGTYDFGQHGYKPLPLQMDLNTLIDLFFGVPPVPDSSTPAPPLWNTVYHEWSRAEAVGVPWTTVGVAGVLGGGQFNPAFPGLTWNQWGDYLRMMHALPFVQGMNPFVVPYYYGLEPYNLLVETAGGVGVRDPGNPYQVQLLEFLQRLHAALIRDDEAGQFLRSGQAERPLQMTTAYNAGQVTQSLTPSALVGLLTDPAQIGSRGFYEDGFTTLPYPMAHVLHTVWRGRGSAPVLGLVFVNWSDVPSAWEGVFDPSCYPGIGTDFVVEGLAPGPNGVVRYPVGNGTGPTTLAWSPAHPGLRLRHATQSEPGFMPPRSVQVFLVR